MDQHSISGDQQSKLEKVANKVWKQKGLSDLGMVEPADLLQETFLRAMRKNCVHDEGEVVREMYKLASELAKKARRRADLRATLREQIQAVLMRGTVEHSDVPDMRDALEDAINQEEAVVMAEQAIREMRGTTGVVVRLYYKNRWDVDCSLYAQACMKALGINRSTISKAWKGVRGKKGRDPDEILGGLIEKWGTEMKQRNDRWAKGGKDDPRFNIAANRMVEILVAESFFMALGTARYENQAWQTSREKKVITLFRHMVPLMWAFGTDNGWDDPQTLKMLEKFLTSLNAMKK